MKLIKVTRKTRAEQRFSPAMGILHTRVTYIKKSIAGVPVKTLHAYRGTYYGEVKDCQACKLTR